MRNTLSTNKFRNTHQQNLSVPDKQELAPDEDIATPSSKRRIAKNTLLLYFRMIFTLFVSLYTCRIVLNSLGFSDYGLYNVVGGVVLMFSIISGSLTSAITRFLSFELGNGNKEQIKRVFATAQIVQLCTALVTMLLIELIGVWFLNHKLNVPPQRMEAANWVLQCSIFTFAINLLTIPYTAAIMSREQMNIYAYISIQETLLKLLAVLALSHFAFYDRLETWGTFLATISLITFLTYRFYCRRHFGECRGKMIFDKALLKQIMGFSGWNFIGSASAIFRDQGVNILINLFFGTVVNAARATSFQVSTAVSGFATNIMTAFNPQITKSYAAGQREYMLSLIRQGSRFSFYMLLLLSVPLLIETPYVLTLFFKNVPEHTTLFVRLLLIFILIESISVPLITAMLATGRIRNYQIIVGGLQLLNFPISYLFLHWGFFPEVTVLVSIGCSFVCFIARLVMLRKPIGLNAKAFFFQVFIRTWYVALLAFLPPFLLHNLLAQGFPRLLCVCFISALSTLILIYWQGCNKRERESS